MRGSLTCAVCGNRMQQQPQSLPQGVARCRACRAIARGLSPKPRLPHGDLYCADCGKQMWKGRTSRPQGLARCLPCRRASRPEPNPKKLDPKSPRRRGVYIDGKFRPDRCADCEKPCIGNRCRQCAAASRRVRASSDHRSKRWQRELAAPGLSEKKRAALRRRWVGQGRSCAYCSAPATTLDHVVPLVRGGTNYEGNLVPCCRRCNSSKAGRTIIEWRTGRRLPQMREVVSSDSDGRPSGTALKSPGPDGAVLLGSELRHDGAGSGGRGEADRGALCGVGTQEGDGSE